jgi:hypothetical protein
MTGTSSIITAVATLTPATAIGIDLPGLLRSGNFVNRRDSAAALWVSIDNMMTWDLYDIGDDAYWAPEETTGDTTRPSNYIRKIWVYADAAGASFFVLKNPTYWE